MSKQSVSFRRQGSENRKTRANDPTPRKRPKRLHQNTKRDKQNIPNTWPNVQSTNEKTRLCMAERPTKPGNSNLSAILANRVFFRSIILRLIHLPLRFFNLTVLFYRTSIAYSHTVPGLGNENNYYWGGGTTLVEWNNKTTLSLFAYIRTPDGGRNLFE